MFKIVFLKVMEFKNPPFYKNELLAFSHLFGTPDIFTFVWQTCIFIAQHYINLLGKFTKYFQTFNQCTTSDYMDCVFGGPLSPSISSRRTSVSSAEGFGSSSGQQGKSSSLVCAAVEATEDAQHFDMSLSPSFIPGSPTHRVTDTLAASGTPNLVHLGTSLVASAIVELDDQAVSISK